MKSQRDLLCEVGVEELPHALANSTAINFRDNFVNFLKENRLGYKDVKCYSTPRRFAILVKSLECKQVNFEEEKRGPSYERAYENGNPTKALIGFCSANNILPEDVIVKKVKENSYIFAIKKIKGQETVKMLPDILENSLNNLRFPKNMKWEESGFRFIRPIRWITFIYGLEPVNYKKVGIESSNYSYGHRVYSSGKIIINDIDGYENALFKESVIAERGKRREIIKDDVSKLANGVDSIIPEEAEILYDINTDLTEYPVPVICEFEEEYLNLPPEVLMSEMIEHQRYFPLYNKKTKELSNKFIAISNIKDNSLTRFGYERVLRARLNDGKFFFDEDQKRNFKDYLKVLKNVSYHPKLGSMEEKVQRIRRISEILCGFLEVNENMKREIDTAAMLCKNDLATLLVNEFPNLQGIMGYYYALASDYSETAAEAIKEHYLPRYANDKLPERIEGAIVSIADRIDSIVGIFSAGHEPKGSKDPYGLRRNVFAIVKIILDKKIEFSLSDIIGKIVDLYPFIKNTDEFLEKIYLFFKNRIKSVFEDLGFAYDEIDATLSSVLDDVYEAYRRVRVLHEIRKGKSFQDLLVAFKRIANIVRDDNDCLDIIKVNEELLKEKDEVKLYKYYCSKKDEIQREIENRDYKRAYEMLGSFKPYVDHFFNEVLVMEDDIKLRCNRVLMLREILKSFSDIIDFSKIVIT